MRTISEYITEGLTKVQQDIIGKFIIDLLTNTKLTKLQIQSMLDNISLEYLKYIGHYIMSIDKEHGISYVPMDDNYLTNDKENISKMFAEYFEKYISNK